MRRILALIALASVSYTASAAEPMGRLFYTPEQRVQLDALRARRHVAPPPVEPAQPAPVPEVLTYDGIVNRSDGRTTLWINDRPHPDGRPSGELPVPTRVRPDHRLSLTLPQTGKHVELRVGESVNVISGSVQDVYARPAQDGAPPDGGRESTKATPSAAAAPQTADSAASDEHGKSARP